MTYGVSKVEKTGRKEMNCQTITEENNYIYMRKWSWLQRNMDQEKMDLDKDSKAENERKRGSMLLYIWKMVMITSVIVSIARNIV